MNNKDFQAYIDSKPSGVVMFYSEYCKVCEKQMEILDKNSVEYVAVCCDDDPEYFIKNHDVDLIPVLRIYEFGISVWQRLDMISTEDLEFIKKYAVP